MSWVSWIGFIICTAIVCFSFRREADILSPGRVFGFTWSLSIALAELKFSGFQHTWNSLSWLLLLTGVGAFLLGIFIAYVLNIEKSLVPLDRMRAILSHASIEEPRLFGIVCASSMFYFLVYAIHVLVRGWLPVFVVGTSRSRVDFNVYGLALFLFSAAFIIFFTVFYFVVVEGRSGRKRFLGFLCTLVAGSYFLLLQRFQVIMAVLICFVLLYYATHAIRWNTVVSLLGVGTAFFYWISYLRFRHLELLSTYLYASSKMRFPKAYGSLTEPYMYIVMNLENFARSVNRLETNTFGFFTFDFALALTGLKHWLEEYFHIPMLPFLNSSYNTYTAFWSFYRDFGPIGLVMIPFGVGMGIGLLYYRMRQGPSLKNVTAYGVSVFVMMISFFVFPVGQLWFAYNMLALYAILQWVVVTPAALNPAPVRSV